MSWSSSMAESPHQSSKSSPSWKRCEEHICGLNWDNISLIYNITSLICSWTLASNWASCSWSLALNWASCSSCLASNWASCSLDASAISNCVILWVVSLDGGGVNIYIVKGLSHFFLMRFVQNPPHVHVHCTLDLSLEQTHHLWTIEFHHYSLLVVVCPLHSKFLSS